MSDSDFAWLIAHGQELSDQYAGKWIAVFDHQVIGVGETAVQAAEKAEEKHPGADFILEAVDPQPERV